MHKSRIEIHKFGGTSVGGAERILAAAGIVQQTLARARVCVVSSAMAGVTERLVACGNGRPDDGVSAWLGALHEGALRQLGVLPDDAVYEFVRTAVREVDLLLRGAEVLRGLSPRARDRVVAVGERLAVELLAATLRLRGVDAVAIAADSFLETTDNHDEAEPLSYLEDRRTAAVLRPLLAAGKVPVVTGFIGRGPDGATRLLGRGGSDLSATLLASALDADEVTIWTDVDGVRSADPRLVPEATRIDHLHYREAAEMSFFGAKVLHPRTMIPVVAKRIPVLVRNSLAPELPGTRVDSFIHRKGRRIKAVTAMKELALVSVEGCGLPGVPGIAARVFSCLAARGISVIMISQSSSEASICFAVRAVHAGDVERLLRDEFRTSLSRGLVEDIIVRRDVGVVAAVGAGMPGQVGTTAATSTALSRAGVNILAIAQGASELSISYAVQEGDVPAAVRAIHEVARPGAVKGHVSSLSLVLIGFGRVGRHLAGLIADDNRHRICAVADRSGYVFHAEGLAPQRIAALVQAKAAGQTLAALDSGVRAGTAVDILRVAEDAGVRDAVVVDCTASPAMARIVPAVLATGADVVTANKEVLACEDAAYEAIRDAGLRAGSQVRGEATVGAGLPILGTIETLLRTGDEVRAIESCLSGTIEYLLHRLQQGATLPAALREATALGYTEPDPLEDLSGRDVLRKAIILGRRSGLATHSRHVRHEPLVRVDGAPDADALAALLESEGAAIAERAARAGARGERLRYLATVCRDEIRVGLAEVPADSPLGRTGSENCVALRTRRYDATPLTISGPGAGLGSTCNGVLDDLLRIADARFERRSRP